MNERTARNLVEKFPEWIAESRDKGINSHKGLYAWAVVKAEDSISRIQWFIHVLYSKGYEIRKKKEE